jgi:signal transduction histidine kinase
MDLRPAMLDDIGVIATITWFCREFQALYSTIGLEKQIDVREDDIPKRLKIVIYRVVQEALNNIAKHARATAAWIILRRTVNSIDLILEDNGIGFNQRPFIRHVLGAALGLSV